MSPCCLCDVSRRRDECERVKRCGARVLTLDQLEGIKVCKCQKTGSWGRAKGRGLMVGLKCGVRVGLEARARTEGTEVHGGKGW